MDERKNIERFFQEKFKNFEAAPPENLWKDIDKSLNKKSNKRKVIPLWWKIAGAAALLAGVLWTGNQVFTPNAPNTIQGVTETNSIDSTSINATQQESVVSSDNKENQINTTPSNQTTDSKTNTQNEILPTESIETEQEVAKSVTKNNSSHQLAEKNNQKDIEAANEAITEVDKTNQNPTEEHANALAAKDPETTKEGTRLDNKPTDPEQEFAQTDVKATDNDNSNKPSLLDAIEEMEKSEQDALASNDQNHNSLRWSVQPNVAPVYYNTLSQGSPLSQQFAENSKEGDVTISFGVNIAYQISKRLSIRSGLNSVDMGYATDGIEFGPAISSASAQQHQLNVRFNSPAGSQSQPNIALSDGKTPLYTPDSELQSRSENSYQGSINQKFGYLEIPLELKYRLVDTKIGVNIIGGFSSLFLTDNKVTISSDSNLKSEVGEASNLNDTSFSTNIGIGLDYKFSEKLLFNLEPMFKYQMGTFSSDDGGFSPYMLGVYTGLSFSF